VHEVDDERDPVTASQQTREREIEREREREKERERERLLGTRTALRPGGGDNLMKASAVNEEEDSFVFFVHIFPGFGVGRFRNCVTIAQGLSILCIPTLD
jgi:hypothetical protein